MQGERASSADSYSKTISIIKGPVNGHTDISFPAVYCSGKDTGVGVRQ